LSVKQSENPLGAVYANRETCQIPMCLLHELNESKIELMGSSFGIYISYSSFERWIVETNNGVNIAIINFNFLFYVNGTLLINSNFIGG